MAVCNSVGLGPNVLLQNSPFFHDYNEKKKKKEEIYSSNFGLNLVNKLNRSLHHDSIVGELNV